MFALAKRHVMIDINETYEKHREIVPDLLSTGGNSSAWRKNTLEHLWVLVISIGDVFTK